MLGGWFRAAQAPGEPGLRASPIDWLRLLLLASLSCALLLADDFLQQCFTSANQAELEPRFVLVAWLLCLGLWLGARPRLAAGLLALLGSMQLIQLAHVSFFGEPLGPADLGSLFAEFEEVRETGLAAAQDHWHVLPAVLLPYGLAIALHLWVPGRVRLPRSGWALLLVFAILAAKPYRASYRDMDAFQPGPTRSALHNSFNAFAFYTVRLAGRPQAELPPSPFQAYALAPIPSQARHVWLVVADSVRADRLGVFGYQRDTTPHLSAMQARGDLLVRPGIAGGVSTVVSLSNLLNMVREPGQPDLLRRQPHNLFALARAQGFRTHWISSQESRLLAHLGSRHLDVSLTREDFPLRFLKQHDHAIADILGEQTWGPRNFVVINLRSAHLPYEENYDQHNEPVARWPEGHELPRTERERNRYDNALRYLDDALADIIARFEKLEGERYLVITGDHGQLLGEGGRWGHNDLRPEVVEVPVLAMARQAPPGHLHGLAGQAWISHHELAVWLAERLGHQVRNPNAREGEHFVQGKLLMGDDLMQRVTEGPDGLRYDAPRLLSRWLREHQGGDGAATPPLSPVRTLR